MTADNSQEKLPFFVEVIAGLTQSLLLKNLQESDLIDEATSAAVARSMFEKVRCMPLLMKAPVLVLTLLFDVSPVIFRGRFSRQLDRENTALHIESWQKSPLGPFSDYIQFFEKMVIFIYFSKKENLRFSHSSKVYAARKHSM